MDTKEMIETLLKRTKNYKKAQMDKLKEQFGESVIQELKKFIDILSLKTEKEKFIEKKLLSRNEIAKILKVSKVLIKYYSDLQIIPFEAGETKERRRRFFDLEQVKKRLKEIKELQRKGMTINDLVEFYTTKNIANSSQVKLSSKSTGVNRT